MSSDSWEQSPGPRSSRPALVVLVLVAAGVTLASLSTMTGEDDRLPIDSDVEEAAADEDEAGETGEDDTGEDQTGEDGGDRGEDDGADGGPDSGGDADDDPLDPTAEPDLIEPERHEPDERLTLPGETGFQLFAHAEGEALYRIDLDTGEVLRGARLGFGAGYGLMASGDVLLAPVDDEVVGIDASFGREPYPVAEGRVAFEGPDAEHVWVAGMAPRGGERVRLARVDGGGTVAEHEFASARLRSAGPAGLILTQFGHISVHDPESGQGQLIGSGQFAGHASGRVFWVDCDGDLTCELVTTRVDGTEVGRVPLPDESPWYQGFPSPTGEHLALPVHDPSDPEPRMLLLDLTNDRVRELPIEAPMHGAAAWAPDGSWLFQPTPQGILAWRADDGARVLLDADMSRRLRAITVR